MNPKIIGAILVFLGAIFFSTKAIFVKIAYQQDIDKITLLAMRMIYSLPFFLAVIWLKNPLFGIKARLQNKSLKPYLTRKDWLWVIFLGVLGYYAASLFDFWGLQYITASLERVILFAYPTIVVILSALLFKTPITRIQIISLLLTYLGIFCALTGDISSYQYKGNEYIWGSFLIFASAVTYAIYLIGTGKMVKHIDPELYNAYAMTVAALAVILHAGLENKLNLSEQPLDIHFLGILLAIISTVLPSFMMTAGMSRIGASNMSIISSVGPVSTIIMSSTILGEKIAFLQIVGTLLVLAGVLLISLYKNRL
jgi:drug/metabolite transporter (DMT)-like permease